MIDFETPKPIEQINNVVETVAVNMMRPVSRYFDEHEHEIPWDFINFMHQAVKSMGGTSMAPEEKPAKEGEEKKKRPPIAYQRLAHMVEMLAWGDAGLALALDPGGAFSLYAILELGSPEQVRSRLEPLGDPAGYAWRAALGHGLHLDYRRSQGTGQAHVQRRGLHHPPNCLEFGRRCALERLGGLGRQLGDL